MLAPIRVPGPHWTPEGHGGEPQKPDQGNLAGRQARMGEQRNADGDADPEARHRFGKRRDAVHDQQYRADARSGTITIQRARSACAPECCSTCDIHRPPPMISSTSSTMGVQRTTAGQMEDDATGTPARPPAGSLPAPARPHAGH